METLDSDREKRADQIADRIVELSEAAFAQGHSYYLMSRLGLDLGKDAKDLQLLTGKKLLEFVRSHPKFKDYSTVTVGGRSNIFALVKGTDDVGTDVAAEVPSRLQPLRLRPVVG